MVTLIQFDKGSEVFSYLLYSRDPYMSSAEISAIVAKDAAYGKFQLNGYVITNATTWGECGVL